MMTFIVSNLANIIISALLFLFAVFIISRMRKEKSGCSGCSGCSTKCSNEKV